jgi:hypothetical protein
MCSQFRRGNILESEQVEGQGRGEEKVKSLLIKYCVMIPYPMFN